ncbi:MAG: hypothetical protein AB1896_14250 [Thermodesulfobacteriota bacterium]
MRGRLITTAVLAALILLDVGPARALPPFAGKWVRTAKYVNGELKGPAPATLILSLTSFSKIVPAPPEEACAFAGLMAVGGGQMKVTVQVSSCPSNVAVGSVIEYAFTVTDAGKTLTTTRAEPAGTVKEVYQRDREGLTQTGTCSHPLCGTYNRTATYVNGQLEHTTPAYTVITEKDYYSVNDLCYNALTINSVGTDNFTMTMIGHNCPTPPGVMGPGTVVVQTYELRDEGRTLIVVNTEYGAEVKTVFTRLE